MHSDAPPSYMGDLQQRRLPLRYVWDDTRVSKDFRMDASWVLEAAGRCSVRARMSLCAALFDWVRWRFDGLHSDPAPSWVSQALWCGTLEPGCMPFADWNRQDWLGPVRGPLWCAMTWAWPAVLLGDAQPAELDDGIQYLSRLNAHVQPDPQRFELWLKMVLGQLVQHHPAAVDNPFEDLFDRFPVARRGELVDPAIFVPGATPSPEAANASAAQCWRVARAQAQPYLKPA
jgi:hypothetical protein